MEQSIIKNDDVLFQWCMLSTDAERADSMYLLYMIVNLYDTMQGFSFGNDNKLLHT